MALVLHKGLQQNLRGQSFALDPGQDQEARIVDHQLQVFLPLRLTPADKALPVLELPGACAKADAGYQLLTGKDVVAQLAARHGRVAQVVVARDIFVPQSRGGFAADRLQCDAAYFVNGLLDGRLGVAGGEVDNAADTSEPEP